VPGAAAFGRLAQSASSSARLAERVRESWLPLLSALPAELAGSRPPLPEVSELRARLPLLLAALAPGASFVPQELFLPRAAFRLIKAMKDPDSGYRPLVRAYERDLSTLRETGDLKDARVLRVELARPVWVERGEEANERPYWASRRSRLVVQSAGKEHSLPLQVLISHRGRWYVTHLLPFQKH